MSESHIKTADRHPRSVSLPVKPALKNKVKRLQRIPKQLEALEDREDVEIARHRLATNDPSQNKTLDDLRKALGR